MSDTFSRPPRNHKRRFSRGWVTVCPSSLILLADTILRMRQAHKLGTKSLQGAGRKSPGLHSLRTFEMKPLNPSKYSRAFGLLIPKCFQMWAFRRQLLVSMSRATVRHDRSRFCYLVNRSSQKNCLQTASERCLSGNNPPYSATSLYEATCNDC